MLVYKYFLVALCLFNFTGFAAESPYWEQYLREKKDGKVSNLREHVRNLCTLPETGVTADDLEERQKALCYFLSTGGKKGFRKTKTSPEEKAILENAHLFLGMVSEIEPFSSIHYDLRGMHRSYGCDDSDIRVYNHFTIAQQYFTVGRMIAKWQLHHNLNYLRMNLSSYYVLQRLKDEFARGNKTADLADELRSFSDRFTPDLMDKGLEIWNKLANALQDPGLPMKPTATKETDSSALRQVLSATDTIVRDTLAYHHAIKIDATNTSSYFQVSPDWSPLPIKKGSRPMVITLEDGALAIKRADNTLFTIPTKSRLWCCHNKVTYLGEKGPQTLIEDSQSLTDAEILDKLGAISPVSSYFYYGNKGDFDDLSLADVWPEPFLIVYPKPRPWGKETPNMQLMKSLEEESITKCEEGIRKLGLRTYKSPFINNKGLIKTLSQAIEQLRKLCTIDKDSQKYEEFCGDLERAINSSMQFMDFPGMAPSYRTKQSELHSQGIIKTIYDILKNVKTNLRKAKYLSSATSFGVNYPVREPYEAKDVPATALPSDPKIEEGEAEIVYSNGVLNITTKTNFTVITFEHFWIGTDATIIADLPTKDSKISLYQRSGKPGFLLGRFEHPQGFANFYFPYGSQGLPVSTRFCLTGGVYTPKSARRYPADLKHYHDNSPSDRFGRWGSYKDAAVDENFLRTPEGQFEQAVLAFKERFVSIKEEDEDAPRVLRGKEAEAESTPEKIAAYRDFLRVCQSYKTDGVEYAKFLEGETLCELAARLCVSVQNLALEERFPVFKEAIQLWEAAEENGYRKGVEEKEKIIKAIAQWYYDKAHAESATIDQSIHCLKEGIKQLETKQSLSWGEDDYNNTLLSQLRRQMKSELGIFLANKAQSLLSQTPWPKAEIESLLDQAETIFKEIKRRVDTAQTNLDIVRKIQSNFREAQWNVTRSLVVVDGLDGASKVVPQPYKMPTEVEQVVDDLRQGKLMPAFLRGFIKRTAKAKDEKYLPLYKALLADDKISVIAMEGLVEAYPHPDLVCLYLEKTKKASQMHLRQLISNDVFMREKAAEFFETFVPSLNTGEQTMVQGMLVSYPAVLEAISAAKKR